MADYSLLDHRHDKKSQKTPSRFFLNFVGFFTIGLKIKSAHYRKPLLIFLLLNFCFILLRSTHQGHLTLSHISLGKYFERRNDHKSCSSTKIMMKKRTVWSLFLQMNKKRQNPNFSISKIDISKNFWMFSLHDFFIKLRLRVYLKLQNRGCNGKTFQSKRFRKNVSANLQNWSCQLILKLTNWQLIKFLLSRVKQYHTAWWPCLVKGNATIRLRKMQNFRIELRHIMIHTFGNAICKFRQGRFFSQDATFLHKNALCFGSDCLLHFFIYFNFWRTGAESKFWLNDIKI